MDYLEGALLGRYWSDTDFETRRHRGMELVLSGSFWALVLGGAYLLNFRQLPGLLRQGPPWFFIFTLLFLVTPLIGKYYYTWPLPVRFLGLGVLFLKYLALFLGIITSMIPLLRIPEDFGLRTLLELAEQTVGDFIQQQSEAYGAGGLIFSIAVMILVSGVLFLLGAYVVLHLPVWIYKVTAWVQRTYDEAADLYFKHRARTPKRQGEGLRERLERFVKRPSG